MTDFDVVANAWAAAKLVEAGIDFYAVRNIGFDVEHECCYGHRDGDYCYCDTSTSLDITIFYFVKGPRGGKTTTVKHHRVESSQYSFESVLRELVEWGTK